jgi:hypothetical protein
MLVVGLSALVIGIAVGVGVTLAIGGATKTKTVAKMPFTCKVLHTESYPLLQAADAYARNPTDPQTQQQLFSAAVQGSTGPPSLVNLYTECIEGKEIVTDTP